MNIDFTELGCANVGCIYLTQDLVQWKALPSTRVALRTIQRGEFPKY
jgi:hypothetical protein